jgi:hypothetical protein
MGASVQNQGGRGIELVPNLQVDLDYCAAKVLSSDATSMHKVIDQALVGNLHSMMQTYTSSHPVVATQLCHA